MKYVLIVVWFIALPYLSRLPRGLDWVLSYLPDEGKLLFGLLFFAAFACLPAIVMIGALKSLAPFNPRLALLPFLVMSIATILAHYDYDLSSDAQAAIWLVVAPVIVAFLGGATTVLVLAGAWFVQWRRGREG